jgi:hypothetical protein
VLDLFRNATPVRVDVAQASASESALKLVA